MKVTHCNPACPDHICAEMSKAGMCLFVEPPRPVTSNWNTSRVRDGWDCWTCGAFITHKQDAADVERDCLKCGRSAQPQRGDAGG